MTSYVSWMGCSLIGQTLSGTAYASPQNAATLNTTETPAQIKSAAGTWDLLSLYVKTNASSTITAKSRINGADGSQVISVGAGLTGWFQDSTHSDVVSSGDLVDVQITSSGSVTFAGVLSERFTSTTAAIGYYGPGVFQGSNVVSGYLPLGGTTDNAAAYPGSDAGADFTWRAPGTFSNLANYSDSGGNSAAIHLRLNGASGNLTTAAGSTGWVYDTTHSDAVASGDKVNYYLDGSPSITGRTTHIYTRFTSADDKYEIVAGEAYSSVIGPGTGYLPIMGVLSFNATEADAQAKAPDSWRLSRLRAHITANGLNTGTTTVRTRINGANGAQSLSFAAGATGYFEDSTNTDLVSAGDLVDLSAVSTASTGVAGGTFALLAQSGHTDATGTGTLPTITMSAPTGSASVVQDATATGTLPTITLTAPTGSGSIAGYGRVPKIVGYGAAGAPDATISAPKIVGYAAGAADGAAQPVAKIVAYAVLGPPPPRRRATVRTPLYFA